MKAFQILLAIFIIGIFSYTGIAGFNHGWNLFPIFFGDIMAMTWPGQFNFDFSCFLVLSGLWLSWRNNFTIGGLALGLLGIVGGIMLLAPYLLYVTFESKGDLKVFFLGKKRANR